MNWISLGAGLGGLSVLLGAFGAHSLKDRLTEQKLATFHTATDYLGYHALALILLGILCILFGEAGQKALKKVGIFFTARGSCFFPAVFTFWPSTGPNSSASSPPIGGLSPS